MLTLPAVCKLCGAALHVQSDVYGIDEYPLCLQCWLSPSVSPEVLQEWDKLAIQYKSACSLYDAASDELEEANEDDEGSRHYSVLLRNMEHWSRSVNDLYKQLQTLLDENPAIEFHRAQPDDVYPERQVWLKPPSRERIKEYALHKMKRYG